MAAENVRIIRVAGGRIEAVCQGEAEVMYDLRLGTERLDQTRAGVEAKDGSRALSFTIPARIIGDGVQVLEISRTDQAETLASVILIAGTPYDADLHVQVAMLRAELDQLKSFIRRNFDGQ